MLLGALCAPEMVVLLLLLDGGGGSIAGEEWLPAVGVAAASGALLGVMLWYNVGAKD